MGDYDGVAVLGGRANESGVRSAVAPRRDEVGEEGDERRREQDRHSEHSWASIRRSGRVHEMAAGDVVPFHFRLSERRPEQQSSLSLQPVCWASFAAPDCLVVECSAVPFLSDFVARSRRPDRALFTPLFCPRFGSSSPSSTLLHSLGQNRTVAHPAMSRPRPRSSAWSIALVACAASLVRLATAHGDHAEIDSNPSATYSELHMAQEVSVLRLRSSQRGRTADPTPSPRP